MAIFTDIDRKLERWTAADVIDAGTAERIRRFESESRRGSDVLVRLALALGGIMVAAGVLLFVAAHWDALSPSQRFLLVLILTGGFHVAGAFFTERMRTLSVTMHALGTAALGAGIFLAGQIFNLQEHWPGGVMLWAIGAVAAWYVLRHSVQAVFAALLIPIWLGGEWIVRAGDRIGTSIVLAVFVAMLALSYLTVPSTGLREGFRRSLHVLGGVAFIPACITIIFLRGEYRYSASWNLPAVAPAVMAIGWTLALGLPLLFAAMLRRTGALYNGVAAVWLLVVAQLNFHDDITQLKIYGLCAIAAIGLIAWGLREAQKNYINVGVVGFALTVILFYFSNVMDKLGRSFALITGGILFLVGGYFLEKIRRKLVRQLAPSGGVA
jgi:uncharacterized membrane protein